MRQTEQQETALRIARQSQLERSLEFFTLRGMTPTLGDWVKVADCLSKYVMEGRTKDVADLMDRAEDALTEYYK